MPALVQQEVIRPQIAITQALLVATQAQLVATQAQLAAAQAQRGATQAQQEAARQAVVIAVVQEAVEVGLAAVDTVVEAAEVEARHQVAAEAVAVDNLI